MGSVFGYGWVEDQGGNVLNDSAGHCPKCKTWSPNSEHVELKPDKKEMIIRCLNCDFQILGCINTRAALRAWNTRKEGK